MNRHLSCIALIGLAMLCGCSGDNPTAKPAPTVVPDAWAIPSFTASSTTPYVESVVMLQANVTRNGATAPDGTMVEFLVSGPSGASYGFNSCGVHSAQVATDGGVASIAFVVTGDAADGTYTVQARVHTVTNQLAIAYRYRDPTDRLQIYQPLIPNVGHMDGGEQVILNGKGIRPPVLVEFVVNGISYPAILEQVIESVPLSAQGTIIVRTPYISEADRSQDWEATVVVTVGADTANQESETLTEAFTFFWEIQSTDNDPILYVVYPNYGSASGGETVTLIGRWLQETDSVRFGGSAYPPAQVVSVSADGMQVEVITPRFSIVPLTQNLLLDVTLTARGHSFTLQNAFLVLADEPTPQITAIAPTSGPLDGGTEVTVFGHGFQFPFRVSFGELEANVVNYYDDTTPSDNDEIICVAPDYSQQSEEPPVAVDVKVTNIETGKVSNAVTYTYGDNLYITGNAPAEGPAESLVKIYGSGFQDPLHVDFSAGPIRMENVSISGTELLVKFPADEPPTCSDQSGDFTVTLIESGLEAQGGQFLLLGNAPTITNVSPLFVQEWTDGTGVTPSSITIYGVRFSANVLVEIAGFRMASGDVEVVDDRTIEVQNIPVPNQFNLNWDRTACTTPDGFAGTRRAPTPVDITVINFPGECSNTLAGGLIYEPGTSDCEPAPLIMLTTPAQFDPTPAGTCSAAVVDPMITNNGVGDLNVTVVSLAGRFFFDAGGTVQNAPGFTVPAFGTFTFTGAYQLYFCPDVDNGQTYAGQLVLVNNSATSPYNINLSGPEAHPIMVVTPTNLPITVGTTAYFTVGNTGGTADLNFTVVSNDPNFTLPGATGGTIPVGGADITIGVDAAAAGTGTLTVTAAEPDATNSPATVNLTAT
jgi:hypothetical protein